MDSSPEINALPSYAELHCLSNFSFHRGASHPEELVARAVELGYNALAITDECSLSGVVRAHLASKGLPLQLIIGSEFQLDDGTRFVLLATDRQSYGLLSHLITVGRRNGEKGSYRLTRDHLREHCPHGCIALWLPDIGLSHQLTFIKDLFSDRTWILVERNLMGDDKLLIGNLKELAQQHNVPLCAAGNVQMHHSARRALKDTLTAIRLGVPVAELGYEALANNECSLRSRHQLQRLYPAELLNETLRIAKLCRFSLDELRYEYPKEIVPTGYSAQSWLTNLVHEGAQQRWPNGTPMKVKNLIEHELKLVSELNYAPYFLTVYDIVHFARKQGILCQGRGSAANSVLCYCLGITEVDPARMSLLFERFISKERDEPPDIDVDFEHERREEVIQYIYQKYGRQRAALAATVITYRPRSALRDVGKALGLNLDQVDRLAKLINWWDDEFNLSQWKELGFDTQSLVVQHVMSITKEILGFPRHLSQHVGGFVISEGLLSHLVPIENASMTDRTVIQWEKDDLEALGLMKVDVLALGMLTAIRKACDYVSEYSKETLHLKNIPAEDSQVYRMLQKADTIGVFQIESRAQMTMLPRLKPKNFYDLVIEIAIVRPGPIQGEMVHPYLARRNGTEPVTYPSEAVRAVLERTLGIPIFQEQVMQLAIVAAGFTPGEADQLRRAMAAWKRKGGLEKFEQKLMQGMQQRGYRFEFAQSIFNQIKGFGDYGFPESHSASFALLAYASAWLKCHHPAAFTCALLNSQPMGFYAPSQLIQDAKRHGVVVLPVDINHSHYDCSLETDDREQRLRLGLRLVKGLSQHGAHTLVEARAQGLFRNLQDFATRTQLGQSDISFLAEADAFQAISNHRHHAQWQGLGADTGMPLFPSPEFGETEVLLRRPTEGENIVADYRSIGLTLARHPLALLRERFDQLKTQQAIELLHRRDASLASIAGLVICRQRPGTASGVIFLTLEDETGQTNIIVWPKVVERFKKEVIHARLLRVKGVVQQEQGVIHIIANRLEDYSAWLGALETGSRDFH